MVQPHSSVNKKKVINAVLDKRLLYCCVDPHLLQAMCEEPQDNVSIECTEHVLLSPKAKLMVQAFQLVGREDGVSWHRSPFLRCSLDWSTAKNWLLWHKRDLERRPDKKGLVMCELAIAEMWHSWDINGDSIINLSSEAAFWDFFDLKHRLEIGKMWTDSKCLEKDRRFGHHTRSLSPGGFEKDLCKRCAENSEVLLRFPGKLDWRYFHVVHNLNFDGPVPIECSWMPFYYDRCPDNFWWNSTGGAVTCWRTQLTGKNPPKDWPTWWPPNYDAAQLWPTLHKEEDDEDDVLSMMLRREPEHVPVRNQNSDAAVLPGPQRIGDFGPPAEAAPMKHVIEVLEVPKGPPVQFSPQLFSVTDLEIPASNTVKQSGGKATAEGIHPDDGSQPRSNEALGGITIDDNDEHEDDDLDDLTRMLPEKAKHVPVRYQNSDAAGLPGPQRIGEQ